MKNKKLMLSLAITAGLFILPANVQAAKGDHGVDWSIYQGTNGKFGYAHDKFAISQIGGTTTGWNLYDQWTYPTQVQYAIAQSKRAHTYIWWQNVTTQAQADHVLGYFLPKVQTPKDSIIALDVESGMQNTQVIAYAIQRIKDAGYTPMVYGYKNYLLAHTDLSYLAKLCQLWLAEYPDYSVTPHPNYNYFPSFDNIGIFQFTSTYVTGGLDGNVDLTGITDSGYKGGQAEKPKTQTPAVKAGIVANDTPKKDISVGYTVKVNFSAKNYATGQVIPGFVKGQPHKVLQISGKKVLLDGIYSWLNKNDVEILATNSASGDVTLQSTNSWTDNLGDTWHKEEGMFTTSTAINLRWGARTSSAKIATLPTGSVVKYDAWSRHDGYVWLRQPRADGYGYLVCRDSQGNAFGMFK
ncbi:1,4-beta-N-acetylmuramidase [Lactobacillus agilis]|uniref:1,4-beta-N-acetylmuramidase n=2 Tax=Ligilactobacillus agilis TaxID=1601 RepID=A0A848CEY2_9LACO|nr:GH25 family lysozyme [Ligilactobacillus agilis]NME43210.1 1,4-beta-N-acetylmuramidase [Ligilactobacillus agilis]